MSYKVIKAFYDLQNGDHYYEVGDDFPVKGTNASDKRIKELSGCNNRQKTPLIVETAEKPKKRKKTGE